MAPLNKSYAYQSTNEALFSSCILCLYMAVVGECKPDGVLSVDLPTQFPDPSSIRFPVHSQSGPSFEQVAGSSPKHGLPSHGPGRKCLQSVHY